jgi:predicted methyltransferase
MMKALFVSGALKYDEIGVWACAKCEGTDIVLKSQDLELYGAFVRWIDANRESINRSGK